jgi:hypothetical protein
MYENERFISAVVGHPRLLPLYTLVCHPGGQICAMVCHLRNVVIIHEIHLSPLYVWIDNLLGHVFPLDVVCHSF